MGNVASHDNRWYLSSGSFTGPLDPAAASLPGWLASWLASEDDNNLIPSFSLSRLLGSSGNGCTSWATDGCFLRDRLLTSGLVKAQCCLYELR